MKKNLFIALALIVPFAISCKPMLDTKKLEGLMTDKLKKDGLTAKSVTCPESREVKADDTFNCTAKFDDGSIDIPVTQDGKTNVTWLGVISGKDLAKKISSQEEGESKSEVTCKDDYVLIKKDTKEACTAKAEGTSMDLDVSFTDDDGKFTVKPKG